MVKTKKNIGDHKISDPSIMAHRQIMKRKIQGIRVMNVLQTQHHCYEEALTNQIRKRSYNQIAVIWHALI